MVEPALRAVSRPDERSEPLIDELTAPSVPRRSKLRLLAAFVIYGGLALFANFPAWPGDPSRIRAGDLDQMVWYLAWTPHAIGHWQNLFATDWLNYPQGVNLAQNTSAPLLGLLTAPLTLTVSPIASLNLLLWLAFPLSALSMFFVLRRWVGWDLAAFVGGALYGFSPYVVAQSVDHLNLAFVPLPPLILLAAYETIRPQALHPERWGSALGALVVAQFFISPEIAATSILIVVLCAVVLAVAHRRSVVPALRANGRALLVASGIVVVGLAYPVWVMTEGPYRYQGPAYPGGVSADLLSAITPTPLQTLVPGRLASVGAHLMFGNLSENGGYIGLPLILLLVALSALCWRNRWIRFAALLAVLTTVLSLGAHLIVDNHVTAVPLPWDLLQQLPWANNVIVARLSLYTAFFTSLLVALGMRDLRDRWRWRTSRGGALASRRPRDANVRFGAVWVGALGVVGLVAVLSLIPSWPLESAPADVPAFFTSGAVNRIPYGSVALISPYPSVAEVQPQMWQAVARMRFRIIGGYALFSGPQGTSTNFPEILRPRQVEQFLWAKATGGSAYPAGAVPSLDTALACRLRSFLLRYRVATVLSTADDAEPGPIDTLYTLAVGPPSATEGGVTAWFGVRADAEARMGSCAAERAGSPGSDR